jgi:hypothetical protein
LAKAKLVEEAVGRSFVFMLRENYKIARGQGVIGYKTPIAPPNFLNDGHFFIAVSQTGIFGPFKQTTETYENHDRLGFKRLVYDDWNNINGLEDVICPFRFDCKPLFEGDMTRGITFLTLQEIIGEDPRIWRGIWEIELNLTQFQQIEQRIRGVQRAI